MYSITVVNPTGEYTLFNTFDDDLKVVNPVLSLELNKSGTLTFQIPHSHPNWSQIIPMASEIYVYNNERIYWIGRPLSIENQFDLMATVTCEGILGYLLDTQVPPFDFTENNSIKGSECVKVFLQRLIGSHNSKLTNNWVDSRKKFAVGTVEVRDPNGNLARSSENFSTTLETINEKLLNSSYGGYIKVSVVGNTRYIDYVETFGASKQRITFGDNLLDLTTHVKTDTLYTVVIPQGAEIGDSGNRVNLLNYTPSTSIKNQIKALAHGGAKYNTVASNNFSSSGAIYDAEGVSKHGRVYVEMTTDDITTQDALALKAAKYIGEVSVFGETLELSAVDLSSINVDYDRFNIGEFANVISLPHNVNAEYQITQMNIDLYNPANSSMTLGGELRTFTFDNTKQIIEFNNVVTEEISSAVQNATALLSGGLGGYLFIKRDENDQPYEILIMNAATEVSATNCVLMNRNGIGFGRKSAGQSGDQWVYRNAWTIDGNLVADFITTGTLSANRIKAGVLADTTGNTSLNMTTGVFTMKKGSINLGGGNFVVNDSGILTMKRGSINLGSGKFVVTDAGNLTIKKGSINLGSGKFVVTDAGSLTANNVNIGGFKLTNAVDNSYALYHDKGVFRTWIRGAVNGADTWVFSAQKKINGTYEGLFRVDADGTLYSRPNFGNHFLRVDPKGITIQSPNTRISDLPFSSRYGNMYVGEMFRLYLGNEGASSRTIKHDIKPVENDELKPDRLYDLEVIQFKYNDGLFEDGDPAYGKDHIGFILEDMAEVYPNAVNMDGDEPKKWNWSPHKMIPPMVQLIKDQKQEIDDLKQRVEKLEQLIPKGEKHG